MGQFWKYGTSLQPIFPLVRTQRHDQTFLTGGGWEDVVDGFPVVNEMGFNEHIVSAIAQFRKKANKYPGKLSESKKSTRHHGLVREKVLVSANRKNGYQGQYAYLPGDMVMFLQLSEPELSWSVK